MANNLRPALVLSAWTFLVWTTRIRNIWTDDELTTSGQIGRTALALVFSGFAVAVVAVWLRARRGGMWPGTRSLVRAFALWTTGVWIIRGAQIALADQGAAFIAVHTVLALVSIMLAVWGDRGLRNHQAAGREVTGIETDRQPA